VDKQQQLEGMCVEVANMRTQKEIPGSSSI